MPNVKSIKMLKFFVNSFVIHQNVEIWAKRGVEQMLKFWLQKVQNVEFWLKTCKTFQMLKFYCKVSKVGNLSKRSKFSATLKTEISVWHQINQNVEIWGHSRESINMLKFERKSRKKNNTFVLDLSYFTRKSKCAFIDF